MAIDDTPDLIGEQVGASAGEYEYDYGSYGNLLEKQLGAITAQAQLEEKERAETGLLGTRNMAILNLALTGRGVVEGAREKYIMNQMQDMGKEAQFISQEKYNEMTPLDRADYQKSTDGRWFKADEGGNWEYEKGPKSKLKQLGNALIGWQQGIEKVATEGKGIDDIEKSAKTIEKNVVPKIDEVVNGESNSDIVVTDDVVDDGFADTDPYAEVKNPTSTIPEITPTIPEVVEKKSSAGVIPEVTDKVFDSDIPAAKGTDLADIPEEDLGDIPSDKAWENVNVKSATKNVTEKRIATGDLNIRGEEFLDNKVLKRHGNVSPEVDKWIEDKQQTKGKGGAMTAAEWAELKGETPDKPNMTSDRWGKMNKNEQDDWRSSAKKMEKRSGLMKGLDSLRKLKDSIVNKIMPPKGYSPSAAFKVDNKNRSLYKQMKGVGISPLNK